jgi:hypothetical protein
MGTLENDLPMALARSPWLGVGMVAAGFVLRNETLVTGNNGKRLFLGVMEKRMDTTLEKLRTLVIDYKL